MSYYESHDNRYHSSDLGADYHTTGIEIQGNGGSGHHYSGFKSSGQHYSGFQIGGGAESGLCNQYNASHEPTPPQRPMAPIDPGLVAVYHLEGYEWALGLINASDDTLLLCNSGSQAYLKLSKDVDPPKRDKGDYECWPGALTYPKKEKILCVYLTRCFAARNFTVSEYQASSCFAGSRYMYAGVCCQESEIDKKP
ncbi:uncharacterized protein LOC120623280 [Pararge aegeria]|uniref:uncharacterized protein LOC120623280 n=1 Tax=Pararge aegeria TaxID=116150 RepID=UPI0019D18840|nr:uncharacterized protein LOC120623280 [Pararge aegeria]